MTELLNMPANEEEQEQLAASGYKGKKANQALLLAQSVLEKAIEKGDVSAFKEVRSLLNEESGDNGELEKMLDVIKKSLKRENAACLSDRNVEEEVKNGKCNNKKGDKSLAQEPE
ncbi:MAG: hypothetical protein II978_04340 [Clostridia bacterium]|nr:hypothetical protein [Clostridia bacterium]